MTRSLKQSPGGGRRGPATRGWKLFDCFLRSFLSVSIYWNSVFSFLHKLKTLSDGETSTSALHFRESAEFHSCSADFASLSSGCLDMLALFREWGGCEVTYGWSHTLAVSRECSPGNRILVKFYPSTDHSVMFCFGAEVIVVDSVREHS